MVTVHKGRPKIVPVRGAARAERLIEMLKKAVASEPTVVAADLPREDIEVEESKTMTKPKPLATVADVRTWAQENGYEVKDRGRLSQEIKTAFTKKTRQKIAPDRRAKVPAE